LLLHTGYVLLCYKSIVLYTKIGLKNHLRYA
jgi:hypothetical protein